MSNMIDTRDINLVGKYHRPYHFNWFSVFAPVVPYVYDGSLSLLEMVHKLLLFINKVNNAVNDNHTDILALAAEVDRLAQEVAELPELIERIEALIALLPPLYLVRISTNGDEATANMTIDEIRAIVADGKMPMAIVDDRIIAIYDGENEAFQFIVGNNSTIIGDFTDNIGNVETTAFITENGGVINGLLTILNAPVNDTDAVNKAYVDNAISSSVKIVPFTVEGGMGDGTINNINIDKSEIINSDNIYNVILKFNSLSFRCVNTNTDKTKTVFYATFRSNSGYMVSQYVELFPTSDKIYTFYIPNFAILEPRFRNIEGNIEKLTPYEVLVTATTESYTSNHFAEEIYEKYSEGYEIVCKYGSGTYQIINCTPTNAVFSRSARNTIDIINVGIDMVAVENNYVVTGNGTTVNNTISSTLRLLYEIENGEDAVNKAYVDEQISNKGDKTIYVRYDLDNGTCEYTCAEILEFINNGFLPIARGVVGGNESWGYLTTISDNNLRYLFKSDVCKHTVALKHNYNDEISIIQYLYVTNKGGEVENNATLKINGRLNITGKGIISAVDESNNLSLINKEYLDNRLGNSVPIVMDVIQNGTTYTLPYEQVTLGLILIRNPYIAIRWQETSEHIEIMYLNGIENGAIIFANSKYKGVYNNIDILTITTL